MNIEYCYSGKVLLHNKDFYLLESDDYYHIIESSDELDKEDVILWDEDGYEFYNQTQDIEISADFVYEGITRQFGIRKIIEIR